MDAYLKQAQTYVTQGVTLGGVRKPVTMMEFGPAYLGGCEGLSNAFVDGFVYMSMLNVMAINGVGKFIQLC